MSRQNLKLNEIRALVFSDIAVALIIVSLKNTALYRHLLIDLHKKLPSNNLYEGLHANNIFIKFHASILKVDRPQNVYNI